MPELTAFFAVGVLLTISANALHFLFLRRSFASSRLENLQKHLRKVSKFWSLNEHQLKDLPTSLNFDDLQSQDKQKALRGAFILGILTTLLSWPGLGFLLLYLFSAHVLAKPRAEHKIFSSPLIANQELSVAEIQSIVEQIQ